jgi:uncharacterized protein (TIGR03000 family)
MSRQTLIRLAAPALTTAALLFAAGPALAAGHGGGGHGGGGHGGGGFHGGGGHASFRGGSTWHGGGHATSFRPASTWHGTTAWHGSAVHPASTWHGTTAWHGTHSNFHNNNFHNNNFHNNNFHNQKFHNDRFFVGGGFWPWWGWGGGWGWPGYNSGYYYPYYYGDYYPDYGYYPSYGYYPDYSYPDVSSSYITAPNGYQSLYPSAQGSTPNNAVLLNILVPPNAELWIGDTKMTTTGSERQYVSPPLTPGRNYSYDIRARWSNGNGQVVDQTRHVPVQAGAVINLDFSRPAPPETAPLPPATSRSDI